ncbi:histone acetylation protein-domain-containing protein [Aspergillus karnatakaensis]|uniref:H3 histone acetyltransferase RTT109 n=1 Tax=Aspergillus karnatakaensis TaxID=1810916 RepID=UPI003CCD0F86
MVLSRSLLAAVSALYLALPTEAAAGSSELQSILKNTHKSSEYSYPTDFTRGILPLTTRSDYWRDIPFYTALSKGCISVEADVWLYNGTLHIGHDESSLTEERTFESLYINPILDVLERQNPKSRFLSEPTNNGVFDASTGQTLYLFVDAKTSGPETFEAVIAALEPLRKKGYLTTVKNNDTLTEGPVTVIGTGNTPYDMVAPVADRDYFYDGPLATLNEPEGEGITSLISPIASTSFTSAVGELTLETDSVDVDLGDLLAKVLPTDAKVTIRHVSSTPTATTALFAAPPGEEPEPTFLENHFLSASVTVTPKDKDEGEEIIVYGIEVLIYTAAHLTTIFVSKADSTGHLHLLKAAPKSSILRLITSTFLSFLVHTHQRPGVRLVVSLFARAQNQYLFPGSIENSEKHVLDDRGLIKWWCRALDPILREYEPESASREQDKKAEESSRSSATAYLIVPSCDKFETRGFFPSTAKLDNKERSRWLNAYPLRQLCSRPDAPPRCLVPRFPDDPKTRFLIDLDDELPDEKDLKGAKAGQWRSVKSLDQFWEMMSFRQECSAGRLVGFLWLVINPPGVVNSNPMLSSKTGLTEIKDAPKVEAKPAAAASALDSTEQTQPLEVSTSSEITPAEAKEPKAQQANDGSAFYWPQAGRGHAVLSEQDYKAANVFLLGQDFYNEEVSFASTKAYNDKVAALADELWIGQQVVGKGVEKESATPAQTTNTIPTTLLVRKRKKDEGEASDKTQGAPTEPAQASGVNVLGGNLIRKKKKP